MSHTDETEQQRYVERQREADHLGGEGSPAGSVEQLARVDLVAGQYEQHPEAELTKGVDGLAGLCEVQQVRPDGDAEHEQQYDPGWEATRHEAATSGAATAHTAIQNSEVAADIIDDPSGENLGLLRRELGPGQVTGRVQLGRLRELVGAAETLWDVGRLCDPRAIGVRVASVCRASRTCLPLPRRVR